MNKLRPMTETLMPEATSAFLPEIGSLFCLHIMPQVSRLTIFKHWSEIYAPWAEFYVP